MSNPAVTIAVAAYNRSKLLACALRSIQMQTMPEFEVWVVGDHCTDDSEQIVAKLGDSRFNWHDLPGNTGSQSGPNNEALRRASGEFIAYLNQDDLWLPWHLEVLLKRARETDADLVHSNLLNIGPPDCLTGVAGVISNNCDHAAKQQDAWLHRRSLVDAHGYWREDYWNLPVYSDTEFFQRLCAGGARFEHVDCPTVLRFPSGDWGNYATDSDAAQMRWLGRLGRDRSNIEVEFGRMALTTMSGGSSSPRTYLQRLTPHALNVPLNIAFHLFGDVWPVSWLRILRQRRYRRRQDRERGLN